MPLSITNLVENEASVPIPVGSETLTVTYRPSKISRPMLRRLRDLDAEDEAVADGSTTIAMLLEIIQGWDLVGGKGEPAPLTEASLEEIGLIWCNRIFKALLEDNQGNRPNAGRSNGSSFSRK